MADIPSLRIGDTLKVPYTIEALIQDQPSNLPVRVDEGLWLRRELVEAAEHIPASRVFKRGDWVKMHLQTQSVDHLKRHGIVAGDSDAGVNVPVLWPQCLNSQFIRRDLLEPDEAPE